MSNNIIGQSLGRYHILEQLGEGGMAVVYKAYDTRLERDVAVKVIRTEKLTIETMGKTLKRFEREAKALAKLTHPNIVPITDYGEHDEKPYLVMPYLPGGTLKQQLKGKPMPWDDAVRLLIPIARALHYAHQQGIIHRDVKPSNILITQSGEPMLTDFGIAKILLDTEETADLTGTGMGVGTPEYMSPEQFQGKGVDARTDIYSLGVVLYEMITGRKPYQADTPAAVLIKQATEPLPRPRSFVSGLPEEVEKLLLKALAKETEDRYQDVVDLSDRLNNLLMKKVTERKTPLDVKQKKPVNPVATTYDTMLRSTSATLQAINPLEGYIHAVPLKKTDILYRVAPDLRRLLWWILAGVLSGPTLGISLAVGQSIIIGSQFRKKTGWWWLIVSMIGLVVGYLMGGMIGSFIGEALDLERYIHRFNFTSQQSHSYDIFSDGIVLAAVLGVIFGFMQWLVLHSFFRKSFLWVFISSLGMVMGLLFAKIVDVIIVTNTFSVIWVGGVDLLRIGWVAMPSSMESFWSVFGEDLFLSNMGFIYSIFTGFGLNRFVHEVEKSP